jgi:ABC-type Fe3+-hydroxamate transport system substrate-binding protein
MKITDPTGHVVELGSEPRRIVSLVPSQTELLADLGLGDRVIGITKFCVHPAAWYREKSRIGGTKTADLNKIKALRPDLVIANKEENVRDQIEAIRGMSAVFTTDVNNYAQALDMIRDLGIITGTSDKASVIISRVREQMEAMTGFSERRTCAYLIWNDPMMVAGHDNFISDMLRLAGFDNVFALSVKSRYPEIQITDLAERSPEVIFLSSEPYPFRDKHLTYFKQHCPGSQVVFADGEMFSWYGSRLMHFDVRSLRLQLGMD